MILEYKGQKPKIGKNVFIAPTATVVGDVEIKDGASIWFGTVLRGDRAAVSVGENSNIQDNCTVHADPGKPAIIGDNVSVGHNAVIHACTIEWWQGHTGNWRSPPGPVEKSTEQGRLYNRTHGK